MHVKRYTRQEVWRKSIACVSLATLIVLVVAIAAFAQGSAKDIPNVHGYIVTKEGKTIHFSRVEEGSKTLGFKYGPEEKTSFIPLANIREVIFGEQSYSARIRLKDGRNIDAKCIRLNDYNHFPEWGKQSVGIHFSYFDDVARKESKEWCGFDKMALITIDEAVGRFRRCPHCKGLWPDSYLFCPHDGVRTVWGEATGSLVMNGKSSKEQRRKKRAHVMEAILNASLARSGVDPASEEASKAKEFGKLWMNPHADPKEIHGKLDELRKDFLRRSKGN